MIREKDRIKPILTNGLVIKVLNILCKQVTTICNLPMSKANNKVKANAQS